MSGIPSFDLHHRSTLNYATLRSARHADAAVNSGTRAELGERGLSSLHAVVQVGAYLQDAHPLLHCAGPKPPLPSPSHPQYFAQCANASLLQGFGEKLGVGIGAFQAPFWEPATDKADLRSVLQYLDRLGR